MQFTHTVASTLTRALALAGVDLGNVFLRMHFLDTAPSMLGTPLRGWPV